MSAAEVLLARLDRVKSTGPGKWKASCPGPNHEHGDRNPSLHIRKTSDGTLLLKCFSGGCGAADIVAAIGLRLSDLFPEPLTDHRRRGERRPFPATDILKAISHECLIVVFAAEDMAREIPLSDDDRERLSLAASRIQEGILAGVLHG
jgi:hypothetical protein